MNPDKNNFPISCEESMKICSQHRHNSYRIALEDAENMDNIMVIRFGDMFKNVEKFMSKLCDFVNLSFKMDMLPALAQ
jgi:hypothetical protein